MNIGQKVICKQNGFDIVVTIMEVTKTLIKTSNGAVFFKDTLKCKNVVGLWLHIPTENELEYQLTIEAIKRISIDARELNFLEYSPSTILQLAELLNIKGDAVDFLKDIKAKI